MKATARITYAAALLLVGAALAACSGGSGTFIGAPHASASQRRPLSLAGAQRTVTATMLQPLTFTVSGSAGSVALYGSTQCAQPAASNPCPNVNFTASDWYNLSPTSVIPQAATLNAACTPPAWAPAPAAGTTPGCYIVAYEGGAGPYLIQGPATAANGTLSFPAAAAALSLDGSDIAYNFFLAYVTAIGPVPTPTPVPTAPSPVPTVYATPYQPPAATPTASPSPLPSNAPQCDDRGRGDETHHHDRDHHDHTRGCGGRKDRGEQGRGGRRERR